MEYLEPLYDSHLFLHYLFPAFLILAPDTGYRTRVNLDSVRIEKAIEVQPRGAMVSISMNDLGCACAYVSRCFGDGRVMGGVAGKLHDRPNGRLQNILSLKYIGCNRRDCYQLIGCF